jgi:hypothetical protein
MARRTPKKGPKMTRLSSHANMSQEEIDRQEFEKERDAHADALFYAIEDARRKMSSVERDRFDSESEAILDRALEDATPQRRRA